MIQTETLQKYIDVFSQMTIPIATMDLESLLLSVNKAFCKLIGYEENELVGKKIPHPFWSEEDIENIKKGFNEIVVQGKTGMVWDMIFAKKDGTRIPVSVITSELKDGDGKVIGYSGFFEDISSRKKAEEALCKSRDELEMHVKERTAEFAKLNEGLLNELTERKKVEKEIENYRKKIETLINSSTDYVFLKDVNFRYIIANKIHEKLFNKRVEDIIGKTDFDFMSKATAEQCRKSDEEALKSGFVSKEEFIDERCFHVVKKKVADEKGEVIGIAAVLREITERKKAEEELKSSELKLQEQKQALEQKNIALKEILEQIEIEKKRIRDDVVVNINELILPILRKIRLKGAPRKYVNLIKNHLDDLTSSFGRNITKENFKLSPREIEICDFIKSDISSKEISNLLNISCQTIDRHRKNIRKKLGICNKNINLTSYLRRL